jgi:hypothetical protein
VSLEQRDRKIIDILRRLDALESRSAINYVTSTYTPTYLGGSTAGTTTYSQQSGFYTRIGRLIFVNGRVVWTNATGTGIAIISLPFTASATGNNSFVVGVRSSGLTFANNNVVGRITNTAYFRMESLLTNAAPSDVNVEVAGDVIFSGYFQVD